MARFRELYGPYGIMGALIRMHHCFLIILRFLRLRSVFCDKRTLPVCNTSIPGTNSSFDLDKTQLRRNLAGS